MPGKKVEGKGIMKKNINFKGCHDTMEEVFGKNPLPDRMLCDLYPPISERKNWFRIDGFAGKGK